MGSPPTKDTAADAANPRAWLRPAAAATVAFAASVGGALALGDAEAWRRARAELVQVTKVVAQRSDHVRAASLDLVAAVSRVEGCDMRALGSLADQAHYVREIGRIEDQRIVCRTLDGAHVPLDLGPPTRVLPTGVRAWAGQPTLWIALGDAALRIDPYHFVDSVLPEGAAVAVLERDHGDVFAATQPPPAAVLGAALRGPPGLLRTEEHLVSTVRPEQGQLLAAAWRPVAEIRAQARRARPRWAALGAALGVAVGLLAALAVRRGQSLRAALGRALDRREIEVELQPIVEMAGATSRIVGFEAMARWRLRDGERVPPDLFVPLAAELGREGDVARCVAARLGGFARTLAARPDLYVSMNLSSREVSDPALIDELGRTFERHRIDPHQIVIELTERGFEAPGLDAGLRCLRQRGHRLGIDDFGTGTSNASRLAAFAPDIVKVDQYFIALGDRDGPAAAFLPLLVDMGRACGADVVVEGVETQVQAARVGAMQGVLGQGYYWHRPMSPAAAADLVADEGDRLATPAAAPADTELVGRNP